jgi:hypothetical protein
MMGTKAELLGKLEQHVADLIALQRQIKLLKQNQIWKAETKAGAASLARRWFDDVLPALKDADFSHSSIDRLSDRFSEMLRITKANSAKNTYLTLISDIAVEYRRDVIHVIETRPASTRASLSIAPYVSGLPAEEGAYLEEAQRCLSANALRGCIVLGWCATVARMHDKIAALGFENFNKASERMSEKQFGRFKPFNKKFRVESASELRRTVFDTDLLWVLEFMELIDSNQHERLRHCFELRNNSAHPGQAPISGENLYSFYSDITKIVLKNPKFDIKVRS